MNNFCILEPNLVFGKVFSLDMERVAVILLAGSDETVDRRLFTFSTTMAKEMRNRRFNV